VIDKGVAKVGGSIALCYWVHVKCCHVLAARLVEEQCRGLADEGRVQGAISYQFVYHALTQV